MFWFKHFSLLLNRIYERFLATALLDKMLVFLIIWRPNKCIVPTCSSYLQRQCISGNTGTRLLQTWTNVSAVHALMVEHVRIKSTDSPANVLLAMMV